MAHLTPSPAPISNYGTTAAYNSECAVFRSLWFSPELALMRKADLCCAAVLDALRSEGPHSADSVEKLRVAAAEIGPLIGGQAPFLSGVSYLLRCRKDLGQFAEVLGGGSE